MKRKMIAFFLCLCSAGFFFSQPTGSAENSLNAHVSYLASDALEGRGPHTRGLDAAADYIAAQMKVCKLLPAGDGESYFQNIDVILGVRAGKGNRLKINDQGADRGKDFIPLGFSGTGGIRGELAFAGYGIIAPEYQYDDFVDIDIAGRIALILTNEPGESDTASAFDGIHPTRHSELRGKVMNAKAKGAVGVIFVNGPKYHPQDKALHDLKVVIGYQDIGIPVIQITQAALRKLLGSDRLTEWQEAIEQEAKPMSHLLPDVRVELRVDLIMNKGVLRNVVGMLSGIADSLKEAPLILGAHYDHLGYGGPNSRAPGVNAIHNGADDNASGVSAMLDIACRLAQREKKLGRPLIFIAFTGEEIGMIGSTHYTNHPTFPVANSIAMLNLDTVGRMVNNQLIVFGVGTAVEWERIINGVNHQYQFQLTLQKDGYGPSDQAAFYARGIPVLHFFTGANLDYHKPSDDSELINYTDLERIAAFTSDVIEYLGNRLQPLTLQMTAQEKTRSGQGEDRPWLGTVPDFTYQGGDGLRLTGVSPGSPCEKAGLQPGDIITKIDDVEIKSIYEVNHVLKNRKIGDEVKLSYVRDGLTYQVNVVLARR